MSESLPWSHDQPLSISQLLKLSMGAVDTLSSNTTLLNKMSTHFNGLLRQQQEQPQEQYQQLDKALRVFNTMFENAHTAMSCDTDKQILNVLKRQVSSFIGVTLGVKPFLQTDNCQHEEKDDEPTLSWSSANEKEFAPEHAEHHKIIKNSLEEESYGQDRGHYEDHERNLLRKKGDSEGEDEGLVFEDAVEHVDVKSREVGGAGGFETVHREHKKKKPHTVIETNFTYKHYDNGYEGGNNNSDSTYRPHKHFIPTEFRPEMLHQVSENTFCIPLFFPSEQSYSVFHAALSTAKESLDVCVYSMTDNDTADVLVAAKKRGVDVKVITDNDQMDVTKGADIMRLHENFQIPYKTDNSDQFMHNKFAVIDRRIVITGSFNWSAGARYKNRENVLITNIPAVVTKYAQEFEKLWSTF